MARRLGDPRALVSALWVKSQIRWGPENVEGRLASATEIASLAESIGDYQRALRAHEMRFTALLEIGDMPGLEAETRAYEALAQKAGEQFGIVERFHAALALLRGDFEQAERQATGAVRARPASPGSRAARVRAGSTRGPVGRAGTTRASPDRARRESA